MRKRNYYKLAEEFEKTFIYGNKKAPALFMDELNDFLKESVKRGANHKEQLFSILDAGIMIGYKYAKSEARRDGKRRTNHE